MAANFAAREKKNADKKIGEVGLLVITYFHRHRKLSHDEKGKTPFFFKKEKTIHAIEPSRHTLSRLYHTLTVTK